MVSPNFNSTLLLANPQDVPELAAITTRGFEASDSIFPMIWSNTAPGAHDAAAMMLFNPIQTPMKITWKAEVDGKVVGYARWHLPPNSKGERSEIDKDVLSDRMEGDFGGETNNGSATEVFKQKVEGGWQTPSGMNFDLFMRKVKGSIECRKRDYDAKVDIMLDLCFVDPAYHKRGIGNMLLEWGIKKADKEGRKICLVSTPQARNFYERAGWLERENLGLDLEAHGGEGRYERCWMIREPQREN
ncbi:hypothetical protein EYC84_002205 [Monilinia fructicola]|uniref:N-acetyltransferase domain-containing protein n=1 Tax=Monilinia fructicola TaxID=38448 RepID=A0A5M9JPX7_MONFR|nr:hypothetical protein EYC84_002205 [Monilinia fructicola]